MKYVACDYFEQLQSPIVASSSFLPCQTASETRILQHLNPVLKASPSLQLASQDLIRIAVDRKRIEMDRERIAVGWKRIGWIGSRIAVGRKRIGWIGSLIAVGRKPHRDGS